MLIHELPPEHLAATIREAARILAPGGSLRILAVNRAMVRHYGYTEAELLGMTTAQLWPPQERAQRE